MIWSIAWKNVWRNKVRSGVVIIAFTLGLFGGLFAVAVMVGMIKQRVKRAIRNEVSHIQIHHPKFQDNYEMNFTVDKAVSIADSIRSLPHVVGVSPRLKIFGMASTAGNATGVMINGIDVDMEKSVTDLYMFIPEGGGSFFGSDEPKSIVIGEKLAKTLKLVSYSLVKENLEKLSSGGEYKKVLPLLESLLNQNFRTEGDFDKKLSEVLGDKNSKKHSFILKKLALKYNLRKKVVLSFQSADGSITYDAFRIQGVYKTNNTGFDGLNVYVRNTDLVPLAGLKPGQAHEIAVLLDDAENVMTADSQIKALAPGLLVETWEEIMPDISIYNKMMGYYLLIFMSIILLALGFGIVNTMLMAVLERVKELGMLMAIGMNKTKVFLMIMLETIFLALTGSVVGMLLSYGTIILYKDQGIDLSKFYQQGLESWGFEARLYPDIGIDAFIQVTLLVVLTGIFASIYPARKALKLNPAEATRIDM
jgi:putative ABC transport system permease protein